MKNSSRNIFGQSVADQQSVASRQSVPHEEIFEVAVDSPAPALYSYLAPPGVEVAVGQMVRVPFAGRELLGYVMGRGPQDAAAAKNFKLKTISQVVVTEPLFGEEMTRLINFVSSYYLYPPGLCVKEILPGGLSPKLKVFVNLTDKGLLESSLNPGEALTALESLKASHPEGTPIKKLSAVRSGVKKLLSLGLADYRYVLDSRGSGFSYEMYLTAAPNPTYCGRLGPMEQKLWELVKDAPATPISHYRNIFSNPLVQARSLAAKGLIEVETREKFRDDPQRAIFYRLKDIDCLTSDQQNALEAIEASIQAHRQKGFLLFGVTGSGKTEVYLRAAEKCLLQGRSVLWMAPEIALTMGLEGRLKERFPTLSISVLHSRLTAGQRHDHWVNLKRGVSKIALGARSAIFAPVENLGLIVVDEEHDWAYKQDDGLRYHGRDLAAWRAKDSGAVLLLGSATPSLESFQGAKTGRLTLLRLSSRPGKAVLPEVVLVDRRGEERGGRSAISPQVGKTLRETFDRGEQALMFINRRGSANMPLCLSCGHCLKCPHCSLSLTLHTHLEEHPSDADDTAAPLNQESLLVCHGCGYRARPAKNCPQCGSALVRYLGVGTESLIKLVEKGFGKKGLRLDTDSAKVKGGLKDILESFSKGEADFLVGTQMAAKGHDFSSLTMVGVVEADLGLNVADFRAAERTFQLLSQVSGRAGRGDKPGKVFIQTRNPDHYTMATVQSHDYEAFFQNEIELRLELGYPPFARMALVRLIGPIEREVSDLSELAAQKARDLIGDVPPQELEIFGPAPAPITKLREKYRYQMMIRSKTALERHRLLTAWLPQVRKILPPDVALTVDVDPYNLL
ncbi:MAG: primosomal protein N' [Deltaproteobacteria bacterium]|nr:primosomal protein N' [Deltaproteobacteria bacterium]